MIAEMISWTCDCGRMTNFCKPIPATGSFECYCKESSFSYDKYYEDNPEELRLLEITKDCEDCDDEALGILR